MPITAALQCHADLPIWLQSRLPPLSVRRLSSHFDPEHVGTLLAKHPCWIGTQRALTLSFPAASSFNRLISSILALFLTCCTLRIESKAGLSIPNKVWIHMHSIWCNRHIWLAKLYKWQPTKLFAPLPTLVTKSLPTFWRLVIPVK